MTHYLTYDGEYHVQSGYELVRHHKEQPFWSARISTGLLGTWDCPSGNSGPKGMGEVIIGVGSKGLDKLIRLGFIPHQACKPDFQEGFSVGAAYAVHEMYGLIPAEFGDKEKICYDARRVDFEELLQLIPPPGRIYLPEGVSKEEIIEEKKRFRRLGVREPLIGWYDHKSTTGFCQYFQLFM